MADNTCLPRRRAPLSQLFQPDLPAEPPSPEAIGATVSVTIDGMETKVPLGSTILEAAKSIGVRIPTLCYHSDLDVAGLCRICVVEVEGQRTLQAACAYPITAPIKIQTYSKAVRIARRHVLDLLLSEHCGECYSCIRNGICELQKLAEEYGVDSFRFGHEEVAVPVDSSSYSVVRDMNKCIRCRRCVRTCIDMQEVGVLEAVNRSNKVEISTFLQKPLADVVCINCGQCINRCPTAALYANPALDQVWRALDDPSKHVVIQTAPSPRAAVGECFGLEPGTSVTYQMNTALRRMGFDRETATAHGFRAMARTMAAERLGVAPEVIEAQLAHAVGDALGRAYNRTTFAEQRRELMVKWADYLDRLRDGAQVVPFTGRAVAEGV